MTRLVKSAPVGALLRTLRIEFAPGAHDGRRRASRRGFATIMALVVLALVVAALTAGGALVLAEQRRTHEADATAELRQMLLAGAQDAAQHAAAWNGSVTAQHWDVSLPAELAESAAKVSIQVDPLPDGTVSADVQAELGGEHQGQTLIYQRSSNVWALARIDSRIH